MAEDRIRSNDAFFQMFVDQIPKDIYHAEENSDMNTKYFKHRKAPLTSDEKKVLSKKRKSEKYGLNGEEGEDEEGADVDGDNIDEPPKSQTKIPVNFTSLSLSKSKKNKDNSNKAQMVTNKANGSSSGTGQAVAKSNTTLTSGTSPANGQKNAKSPAQTPEELHQSLLLEASQLGDEEMELDIDMNDVKTNNKGSDAGKPGSKVRRLKRMLQEAEAKRQRLESLKKSGLDGQEQAQKELWADALIDASGAKSVTDTGKLRKALKRIDKSKERSAREWQGRLEAVEEAQSSKQDRREQNLKNRKIGGPMISSRDKDGTSRKSEGHTDGNKDGSHSSPGQNSNHGHGHGHGHGHKGATGSLLKPLGSKHGSHGGGGGKPGFDKKFKNRPGFEGKKKLSSDRFLNSPKA